MSVIYIAILSWLLPVLCVHQPLLKSECDPITLTFPEFLGWNIGGKTCQGFSTGNVLTLCRGAAALRDTFYRVTIDVACCICAPSSSPTGSKTQTISTSVSTSQSTSTSGSESTSASFSASLSVSASPSQSPSFSASESGTESESTSFSITPSPSPSPESQFIFPPPSTISLTSGGQFPAMTPVFGSSIRSADFSQLPIVVPEHSTPVLIGSTFSNAALGDILIGYIDDHFEITSSFLLSAIDPNGLSFVSFGDALGSSCILLPDLDGNGVAEILVSAKFDDSPAGATGTVYLMFLDANMSSPENPNLRVAKVIKIGAPIPDEPPDYITLSDFGDDSSWRVLGTSLAAADLDGDGFIEILLGSPGCSTCYTSEFGEPLDFPGQIFVLTLNKTDVTEELVLRSFVLHAAQLGQNIPDGSEFGYSMTFVADMDLDGRPELLIGAPAIDDQRGAAFIVSLVLESGILSVRWAQKLVPESLQLDARYGSSVAQISDLNHDGMPELAVGASYNSLFSKRRNILPGEVHIFSLNNSKSQLCAYYEGHSQDPALTRTCGNLKQAGSLDVLTLNVPFPAFQIQFSRKMDQTLVPQISNDDAFGEAISFIGDVDGDGTGNLAIGAPFFNQANGAIVFVAFPVALPSITPTPSVTPTVSTTQSTSASSSVTESASATVSPTVSPSYILCKDCLQGQKGFVVGKVRLYFLFVLGALVACCCRRNSWHKRLRVSEKSKSLPLDPALTGHNNWADSAEIPPNMLPSIDRRQSMPASVMTLRVEDNQKSIGDLVDLIQAFEATKEPSPSAVPRRFSQPDLGPAANDFKVNPDNVRSWKPYKQAAPVVEHNTSLDDYPNSSLDSGVHMTSVLHAIEEAPNVSPTKLPSTEQVETARAAGVQHAANLQAIPVASLESSVGGSARGSSSLTFPLAIGTGSGQNGADQSSTDYSPDSTPGSESGRLRQESLYVPVNEGGAGIAFAQDASAGRQHSGSSSVLPGLNGHATHSGQAQKEKSGTIPSTDLSREISASESGHVRFGSTSLPASRSESEIQSGSIQRGPDGFVIPSTNFSREPTTGSEMGNLRRDSTGLFVPASNSHHVPEFGSVAGAASSGVVIPSTEFSREPTSASDSEAEYMRRGSTGLYMPASSTHDQIEVASIQKGSNEIGIPSMDEFSRQETAASESGHMRRGSTGLYMPASSTYDKAESASMQKGSTEAGIPSMGDYSRQETAASESGYMRRESTGVYLPASSTYDRAESASMQKGSTEVGIPSMDDYSRQATAASESGYMRRESTGVYLPASSTYDRAESASMQKGSSEVGIPSRDDFSRQGTAASESGNMQRGSTGLYLPASNVEIRKESAALERGSVEEGPAEKSIDPTAVESDDPSKSMRPPVPKFAEIAALPEDDSNLNSGRRSVRFSHAEHTTSPKGSTKKNWDTVSAGGYLWGGSKMRVEWGRKGAAPSAPVENDDRKALSLPKPNTSDPELGRKMTPALDLSRIEQAPQGKKSSRWSRGLSFFSPRSVRSKKSARSQNSGNNPASARLPSNRQLSVRSFGSDGTSIRKKIQRSLWGSKKSLNNNSSPGLDFGSQLSLDSPRGSDRDLAQTVAESPQLSQQAQFSPVQSAQSSPHSQPTPKASAQPTPRGQPTLQMAVPQEIEMSAARVDIVADPIPIPPPTHSRGRCVIL